MTNHLRSIKETAAALGISRSKLFLEIKAGKIAVRKIGSRTLISDSEIARYLGTLPEIRRGRAA
ncbi:helix-turn-helix domain-containing protein [Aminobacter sp. AP02]|uniref:helix-turn-helix domain-containing protein n=1 Tax=Aminobacter sp. AP02 TaxID=2135737 RepID=UPI000D6C4AC4|nr:helix-turn-helix domain-containing protein [Aminobacter sp. AP02]PWK66935.1 excisionase family DNA binding protein [Aminobacter sp. AP02]